MEFAERRTAVHVSRHNCLGVGCMKRETVVRRRRPTVDTVAAGIGIAVGRLADEIGIADTIESGDKIADKTAGSTEP